MNKYGYIVMLMISGLACSLSQKTNSTPTLDNSTADACHAQTVSSLPLYPEPNPGSEPIRQLSAGEQIPVTASSDTGWYRVDTGNGETAWIVGSFDLVGACDNLPIENLRPTSECQIINTSGQAVGIQSEPGSDDFFGRFQPDTTLPVFAERDGWYQVYVDAFSNYGWVSADGVTLEGNCENLPEQRE